MKVLIAVDESTHSKQAVSWVSHMAWLAGTDLTVLAVARSPMVVSTEMYAPGLSYDDEILKAEFNYRTRLAEEAADVLKKTGHPATARVVTGDPRLEIVDMAKKEKADLIVMGSHGRTGLSKLLLGSVAAHVVT
ncbi:MAG: UspA domain-containing protein, partial [bacterium]